VCLRGNCDYMSKCTEAKFVKLTGRY
jgi:hypothetical protein